MDLMVRVSAIPAEMKSRHFSSKTANFPLPFQKYGVYFDCQQLRMGIRLFPCCLTAHLTCKNSAPILPHREREKSPF